MKSAIICAFLCTTAVIANTFVPEPIVPLKDLDVQESESRIISGIPAQPGQFPYQVANYFKVNNQTAFCGGALICDRWVLTAAHCAKGASSFTLYLGSVNQSQSIEEGRVIDVTTEAIVHEKYSSITLRNDVALIKLSKPVKFTDRIQPIALRTAPVAENVTVTVSGWGLTQNNGNISSVLNHVSLTTVTNVECKKAYGFLIGDSTLCCKGAPHHSTCSGDSGGPLVVKNEQGKYEHVGVVSFVHKSGCDSGSPSGYVRTEKMHSWIKSKIGNTCTLA